MPYIKDSKYDKSIPFLHKNGHFSTIYAARVKQFYAPNYQREKLELLDGDFLTVDYKLKSKEKAVIICHGLEGNSKRTYVNSCADYFLKKDFSVFAWNNRSCGGEMNRLPRLYHHATIEDLDAVVQFALSIEIKEVYLIG
ncbi:MAG: putative alpha/beta-fold hydrolase, partial [Flavobacterium sp.]